MDSSLRLNQMIIKLRKQGFRLTPQRLAILKILASSEEHLSVEKIYERVKTDYPVTSLATIYKTVAVLKDRRGDGAWLRRREQSL